MKRISTEAELELKEAKEAIKTLKDYCESRGGCDNCDREMFKWCNDYILLCPSDWRVNHER